MAGILLSRARPGQCRWLVCEAVPARKDEPRDTFGGRRVCGAQTSGMTSYCEQHRLRVYERAPVVRPAWDASIRPAPRASALYPDLVEVFG